MQKGSTEVYFSLGANLGDREQLLNEAVNRLEKEVGGVFAHSSFCETEPWGFASEHLFLNMTVGIETVLDPFALLEVCKRIEREMGRQQTEGEGYEDRLIDIDLLLYGMEEIKMPDLEVPHPKLHLRRFVLEPLSEIAPWVIHPVLGKTIEELLNKI